MKFIKMCISKTKLPNIPISPIWLPSVNLYESTVPFSEKVSIVTPASPPPLTLLNGINLNFIRKI